jgi:cystathionine gamma-lyase
MSFHPDTLAIRAGLADDTFSGAVTTPIHQTTTFAQYEIGGRPEYCYSRTGNPTRTALEKALADLEGAPHALAFSSGMAAAHALLTSLSSGDHVVASRDLYGGCFRIFTKVFNRFGVTFSLVDSTNTEEVAAAIRPTTRLLWLETPSNPLLRLSDIAACVDAARRRNVRVVVDNTFATPILQRPLDLGADVVLHSTTKYIGGHCDVLGGAIVTRDESLFAELKFLQNACGAVPGPQDCFLLLRGLRTLPLRVRKQTENAGELADRLGDLDCVREVHYPGLASHPQHELALRQTSGHGAIVSLELEGGLGAVKQLVRRSQLWTLAESLGGVRSLLCHPATMTHASVDPDVRRAIGIGDGLVRLSVGLEDPRDLFDDLRQSLADATCVISTASAEEALT